MSSKNNSKSTRKRESPCDSDLDSAGDAPAMKAPRTSSTTTTATTTIVSKPKSFEELMQSFDFDAVPTLDSARKLREWCRSLRLYRLYKSVQLHDGVKQNPYVFVSNNLELIKIAEDLLLPCFDCTFYVGVMAEHIPIFYHMLRFYMNDDRYDDYSLFCPILEEIDDELDEVLTVLRRELNRRSKRDICLCVAFSDKFVEENLVAQLVDRGVAPEVDSCRLLLIWQRKVLKRAKAGMCTLHSMDSSVTEESCIEMCISLFQKTCAEYVKKKIEWANLFKSIGLSALPFTEDVHLDVLNKGSMPPGFAHDPPLEIDALIAEESENLEWNIRSSTMFSYQLEGDLRSKIFSIVNRHGLLASFRQLLLHGVSKDDVLAAIAASGENGPLRIDGDLVYISELINVDAKCLERARRFEHIWEFLDQSCRAVMEDLEMNVIALYRTQRFKEYNPFPWTYLNGKDTAAEVAVYELSRFCERLTSLCDLLHSYGIERSPSHLWKDEFVVRGPDIGRKCKFSFLGHIDARWHAVQSNERQLCDVLLRQILDTVRFRSRLIECNVLFEQFKFRWERTESSNWINFALPTYHLELLSQSAKTNRSVHFFLPIRTNWRLYADRLTDLCAFQRCEWIKSNCVKFSERSAECAAAGGSRRAERLPDICPGRDLQRRIDGIRRIFSPFEKLDESVIRFLLISNVFADVRGAFESADILDADPAVSRMLVTVPHHRVLKRYELLLSLFENHLPDLSGGSDENLVIHACLRHYAVLTYLFDGPPLNGANDIFSRISFWEHCCLMEEVMKERRVDWLHGLAMSSGAFGASWCVMFLKRLK